MWDKLILTLVVALVIAGHVALYRWVRFKIDEGAITQALRDAQALGTIGANTAAIATQTQLSTTRVAKVCHQSTAVRPSPDQADHWQIG